MTSDTKLATLIHRLRQSAKKATPGPWRAISRGQYWGEEEGDVDDADGYDIEGVERVDALNAQDTMRGMCWLRDAEFIARANPENILFLLDKLEQMQKDLDQLGLLHTEAMEMRDAALADAERYRFIRANQELRPEDDDEEDWEFLPGAISRIYVGQGDGHSIGERGAELDAAIDAAAQSLALPAEAVREAVQEVEHG